MRTRGALGFEARRGRRYPLSLATIVLAPALALAVRMGIDLNFVSYPPLIAAAVLTALAVFALFWRFDPQLRGDLNQIVSGVVGQADGFLDRLNPQHVPFFIDQAHLRGPDVVVNTR